jgi:hypothetical protein
LFPHQQNVVGGATFRAPGCVTGPSGADLLGQRKVRPNT